MNGPMNNEIYASGDQFAVYSSGILKDDLAVKMIQDAKKMSEETGK